MYDEPAERGIFVSRELTEAMPITYAHTHLYHELLAIVNGVKQTGFVREEAVRIDKLFGRGLELSGRV